MRFCFLQNMSVHYSSQKYNMIKCNYNRASFFSFLEYIFIITFQLASIRLRITFAEVVVTEWLLHKTFCAQYFVPFKKMFGVKSATQHETATNFFSPVTNQTFIFSGLVILGFKQFIMRGINVMEAADIYIYCISVYTLKVFKTTALIKIIYLTFLWYNLVKTVGCNKFNDLRNTGCNAILSILFNIFF